MPPQVSSFLPDAAEWERVLQTQRHAPKPKRGQQTYTYCYTRLSRDEEKNGETFWGHPMSIEYQLQECLKYHQSARGHLPPWGDHGDGAQCFADKDISGRMPLASRPAGKQMIETVQAGDAIVCMRVDRFSRDMWSGLSAICDLMEKRGVVPLILRPDLSGAFNLYHDQDSWMFISLLKMAEWWVKCIAQSTTLAHERLKAAGIWPGGHVPYWLQAVVDHKGGRNRRHRPRRRILVHPERLTQARRLLEKYNSGMTYREVGLWADKQGWRRPGGKKWIKTPGQPHCSPMRNMLTKFKAWLKEYEATQPDIDANPFRRPRDQ
jgi:DNA invertase Pin-like site-specific DNA recombinase